MLRFNVLDSSCHLDGEEFAAGEHEIADPSPALVRLAGSAHAAGVIEVSEGLDTSHVESQEDSEAKLTEAMGSWVEPELQPDGTKAPGYWDGPWWEGHMATGEAAAAGTAQAEVAIDVAAGEDV